MTKHSIRVVPVPAPDMSPRHVEIQFQWRCQCGASGNVHQEHQLALEHGIAHLNMESNVTFQQG